MFKEHDIVVLTADLPEEGLEVDDIGTIVHIFPGGEAFVVEFMTSDGWTVAITDVLASQMRLASRDDTKHARKRTAKA